MRKLSFSRSLGRKASKNPGQSSQAGRAPIPDFSEFVAKKSYDPLLFAMMDAVEPFMDALSSTLKQSDMEDAAYCLMLAFESGEKSFELLTWAIRKEVAENASASTLFRANNLASKLLSAYAKMTGVHYYKTTLGPIVAGTLSKMQQPLTLSAPSSSSSSPPASPPQSPAHSPSPPQSTARPRNEPELPPELAQAPPLPRLSTEESVKLLKEQTTEALFAILQSLDSVPPALRRVSAILRTEVDKKFPGEWTNSVGSFLFLRLLCPAFTSPHHFDIIRMEPSSAQLRNLVYVSRVLQLVASGSKFPEKETVLCQLNSELEKFGAPMLEFYRRITLPCEAEAINIIPLSLLDDVPEALSHVHWYMDRAGAGHFENAVEAHPKGTKTLATNLAEALDGLGNASPIRRRRRSSSLERPSKRKVSSSARY